MKTYIILLLLAFFSCSQVEKRKIIETYPEGQTKKEKVYPSSDDTLTYTEITYFLNGNVKTSFDFYNGKFNGKLIEYHDNGKKKFEGQTVMSDFIGVKLSYDIDGNICQVDSLYDKCYNKNCCCDGVVTKFYSNGKIKERFINRSGLVNGDYKSYHSNGQIEVQGQFENDKEEGLFQYWYEDGGLRKRVNYHNGLIHGEIVEYYKHKYDIHGNYVNGKEEGSWTYIDSLGNVLRTDIYNNGKLIKPEEKIN